MTKNLGIFLSLFVAVSAFGADQNAADVAKAKVKANIAKYFEDNDTYRCHELRGYGDDARKEINAVVVKIRAFYDKAVAVHYKNNVVQAANQNEYAELAAEGRQLELQFRGKIGDQWFRVGLIEKHFAEEMEYHPEGVGFSCSQELLRAMALVAPAKLEKKPNGDHAESAFFTIDGDKVLKTDATKYAALASYNWFGEAGLVEIILQQAARGMSIGGYFKDVWFFGVARALRYKAANGDYGLSAVSGKVAQAKLEYTDAENLEEFEEFEKTAAKLYLKNAEDLIAAGREFLNASR